MIDSRILTYSPHPYLGLYDGFACFRLEPYLATDTLLFQLGNINQKRTTKQKNRRLRFPFETCCYCRHSPLLSEL